MITSSGDQAGTYTTHWFDTGVKRRNRCIHAVPVPKLRGGRVIWMAREYKRSYQVVE